MSGHIASRSRLHSGITELVLFQGEFYELLNIFFPNVYDVKFLTMNNNQCEHLRGGLNKIADQLEAAEPYLSAHHHTAT